MCIYIYVYNFEFGLECVFSVRMHSQLKMRLKLASFRLRWGVPSDPPTCNI